MQNTEFAQNWELGYEWGDDSGKKGFKKKEQNPSILTPFLYKKKDNCHDSSHFRLLGSIQAPHYQFVIFFSATGWSQQKQLPNAFNGLYCETFSLQQKQLGRGEWAI